MEYEKLVSRVRCFWGLMGRQEGHTRACGIYGKRKWPRDIGFLREA